MFSEYEHMENHYNLTKLIEQVDTSGVSFVALEKIHGTNYSFMCDGVTVIPAKRSHSLGADRSYYGHGAPFLKYQGDILVIFDLARAIYPNIKFIQLYCELFGGRFKGKTEKGYKCVQKSTNYTPINDIFAYDLKITLDDDSFTYCNFSQLLEFFKDSRIKLQLVPIIKIGTLEELLQLSPKFITRVPALYGLEELHDNYAEGYVIKPMNEMKFSDDTRLILKYKNPHFSEVCEQESVQVVEKTMTFQQMYLEKLKAYVTPNRFNNLVTKHIDDWSNATITKDIENNLIQLMLTDIKTDFIKDNENDDNFNLDYMVASENALRGFLTGFVKKMVRDR